VCVTHMDGPLLDGPPPHGDPPARPSFGGPLAYAMALVILVVLTVGDSVLGVVLFDLFDERLALFVNQGTALVYIVTSLLILAALRLSAPAKARAPTAAELHAAGLDAAGRQRVPWYVLVSIGCLNGSGNFGQAVSQPHTPGLVQTLLQLLGIPLVLALAWLMLRRRPSLVAVVGAALIVGGTAISSLRGVIAPEHDAGSGGPVVVYSYSILLPPPSASLHLRRCTRSRSSARMRSCIRWSCSLGRSHPSSSSAGCSIRCRRCRSWAASASQTSAASCATASCAPSARVAAAARGTRSSSGATVASTSRATTAGCG